MKRSPLTHRAISPPPKIFTGALLILYRFPLLSTNICKSRLGSFFLSSFSNPCESQVSLKNMSGLEGVKTNHLSTQHSVDLANNPTKRSLSTSTTSKEEGEVQEERENNPSRTSVSSSIVSIEENRVKIQVPGLPLSGGGKEANNK